MKYSIAETALTAAGHQGVQAVRLIPEQLAHHRRELAGGGAAEKQQRKQRPVSSSEITRKGFTKCFIIT